MATTTRADKRCITLSLLGLSLVSMPSYSEQTKDWKISPTLLLGLDYSSNMEFASSDESESFIARITPGIDISR